MQTIPINIWDDFYEDGEIPEGKKQETYIYVEDTDLSHEKRKECLDLLLKFMSEKLNLEGVKMWLDFYDSTKKYPNIKEAEHPGFHFCRWEIKMENITHERLYILLTELEDVSLSIDGMPFNIYSES